MATPARRYSRGSYYTLETVIILFFCFITEISELGCIKRNLISRNDVNKRDRELVMYYIVFLKEREMLEIAFIWCTLGQEGYEGLFVFLITKC